jgi:FHA domain
MTNLCDDCAADLDTPIPFVPEQVMSVAVHPQRVALVDVWGRLHALERHTAIGRTPSARGMSILHASVSRRHAELFVKNDVWYVRDLGSSNGTRVNEHLIDTETVLAAGDRLCFGAVGFYLIVDDGKRVDLEPWQLDARTLRPEDNTRPARSSDTPGESTNSGLPRFRLRVIEAPAGNGGYLEAAGQRLQLSLTQHAMLRLLVDRMQAQAEVPELVRGFVPSGQLIADLPWDATSPDENHLKQMIRRTRRALDTIRLGSLIESRRGFGYRLRVIPITD